MSKTATCLGVFAITLALVGCSIGDGSDTPEPATGMPGRLPPIEHNLGPGNYRSMINGALRFLNTYWGERLEARGLDAGPPDRLVSYWTRKQDPRCGGVRAGWSNAQYCPPTDTISWDGYWVLNGMYRRNGEAAAAFLLAHEYGHLVQKRLGIINEFPLTIEGELNADCLAGAWLTGVDNRLFRLTDADIDSLIYGIFAVADPSGVPWKNPSAHGTARERRQALLVGADRGLPGCLDKLGPGFSS